MHQKFEFEYDQLADGSDLSIDDQELLEAARKATQNAYAPYSNFQVGAAARLSNGQIVIGANQESASFPVGVCAERALLNSVGSQFPSLTISTMAISYQPVGKDSKEPISPCGMCRQMLAEYEERTNQSIRIILSGMKGEVYIINSVTDLLPLTFSGTALK